MLVIVGMYMSDFCWNADCRGKGVCGYVVAVGMRVLRGKSWMCIGQVFVWGQGCVGFKSKEF